LWVKSSYKISFESLFKHQHPQRSIIIEQWSHEPSTQRLPYAFNEVNDALGLLHRIS
jgi:hypothetical protein